MSIRLSKACKDLNVGMHTAIEFLAKKGHKLAQDPNLKLDDDLHLLLAKEFNKDMALKIESERISQERHLKEKAGTVALEGYNKPKPVEKQPETIHVTISADQLPHFKAVGHIDLESKDKPAENKPAEIKVQPAAEKPLIVEKPIEVVPEVKKEEPKVVIPEVKPEPAKIAEVVTPTPQPKPIVVIEEPVVVKEEVKPTIIEKQVEEKPIAVKPVQAVAEEKIELTKPVKKIEIKAEEPVEVVGKNTETKDNDHQEDEIFSLADQHWILRRWLSEPLI